MQFPYIISKQPCQPFCQCFLVGMKCTILVNLLTTTKIESYPCANSNFVMKFADMCAQGFSGMEFASWLLYTIFVLLADIISFHILFHLLHYSWPPEVLGNQFHHLPLSFMTFYWHIMIQPNYFHSELIIFWYMDFLL